MEFTFRVHCTKIILFLSFIIITISLFYYFVNVKQSLLEFVLGWKGFPSSQSHCQPIIIENIMVCSSRTAGAHTWPSSALSALSPLSPPCISWTFLLCFGYKFVLHGDRIPLTAVLRGHSASQPRPFHSLDPSSFVSLSSVSTPCTKQIRLLPTVFCWHFIYVLGFS